MFSKILLNEPHIAGNEWKYVKECLDTEWVSSAGKYVDLFEKNIAEYTGVKYAVACVNGTSALQVSLRLAGIKPDDEVIVPTLTFIAPVNAITYFGASPIFMDADRYYNIDVEKTIHFINNETFFKNGFTYNKNTRNRISAIVPVHVWGNAVWLDKLVSLCKKRNIAVVEDATESLGTFYRSGKYKGQHTGTIGMLGCLSFNGNKIITSGGGGMILSNDSMLAEKARYLTTQAKDEPVRYVHNEVGYNFRLTNIQAALGVAQLEQLPDFLQRKREIYHHYQTALDDNESLAIAGVPDYAKNNHWMNILKINTEIYHENLEVLMQKFENNGIQARPVWKLNHLQKPYLKSQNHQIECAYDLHQRSLCIPSSVGLTKNEINQIIEKIRNH